jgi:hypothetical protein
MKQSPPSETNGRLAGQEIPRLLLNLKVHNRVHKSPQLVPILDQMNSVYIFISYLFKVHLNIILHSTPRYPLVFSPKVYTIKFCISLHFLSSHASYVLSSTLIG